MDDIDCMILAELQENGRLTVTELADRVQLTPAPCHRRLDSLPGIMRITSTIVMKRIVDNRPLPLPATSGRARPIAVPRRDWVYLPSNSNGTYPQ